MRRRISDWVEHYRHMDWAVLYMRLFAGGSMLLHNIGKIQDYNEIITSYPTLGGTDPALGFVIIAVIEVLLAVLVMLGIWVRLSALLLTIGVFLAIAWGGFGSNYVLFTWLGIYLFLVISGGGLFSFDEAIANEPKK